MAKDEREQAITGIVGLDEASAGSLAASIGNKLTERSFNLIETGGRVSAGLVPRHGRPAEDVQ